MNCLSKKLVIHDSIYRTNNPIEPGEETTQTLEDMFKGFHAVLVGGDSERSLLGVMIVSHRLMVCLSYRET